MTVGEKIKKRRIEMKMTTSELGAKIGVQSSAISKYEKGRVDPKSSTLQLLAEALEVSPVWFLTDTFPELTAEEMDLLIYFRKASDEARSTALNTLRLNPKEKDPDTGSVQTA